jgi:nucleotide-binding universal stress UspA family protein
MKVLVCLDLSPLTKAIADEAGKIAKMTGASLALLHAVRCERAPGGSETELAPPSDLSERTAELEGMADALRREGADVGAAVKLCDIPIHQFVIDESVRDRASLILLGSHGRGRMFELLVGSVTQGVIRESLMPVIVVTGLRSVGGPG